MNELEERQAPRRNPLLRPFRFILHWAIKLIVLFFVGIRAILRPKLVRLGIGALLIAGIIGWNFFGIPGVTKTPQAQSTGPTYAAASTNTLVSVPSGERLDRSPVVESYLKAQSDFDANGMWATISDDLKQQLASSNTSLRDLQAQLD